MAIGTTIKRLIPFFGYHHVLMMLQTASIILTSILLAGCSSYSSMINVYILGLSYSNSTTSVANPTRQNLSDTLHEIKGSSDLEVRVGYFGMCVRQRGVVWLCNSDANGLAQQIGQENDPLDLIGAAAKFKDGVIFSGLLIMAVVLAFASVLLLSTFPGWHEERDERTGSDVDIKPFPSRPVSQVALSCSFVGAVLLLVSGLWQHVGSVGAASMADIAYKGNVDTHIGALSVSMAWVSFTIMAIVAIGLLVLILSIIILDRLTDD